MAASFLLRGLICLFSRYAAVLRHAPKLARRALMRCLLGEVFAELGLSEQAIAQVMALVLVHAALLPQ